MTQSAPADADPRDSSAFPRPDSPRSSNASTTAVRVPQRRYLTIDHVIAPLLGVLILLATTTIGGEEVKVGIVGEGSIEPYDVLALFISLAYIAISLDATGVLRYLAFVVCIKAGKNGFTLFMLLYAFFFTLGVAVGNDPVILSGTAFLVYFTRVAGISPPSAWIWAQFVAANISSAVLVSSNPTNLVIAKGFDVSFIDYTAYMALPSVASALAAVGAILLFFRNRPPLESAFSRRKGKGKAKKSKNRDTNTATSLDPHASHLTRRMSSGTANDANGDAAANGQEDEEEEDDRKYQPIIFIPPSLVPPDVDPRSALVDPSGAIFGSIIMAVTLVVLIATSVIGGVKVFMVALPGAVLCLLRDAAHDWYKWRGLQRAGEKQKSPDPPIRSELGAQGNGDAVELKDLSRQETGAGDDVASIKATPVNSRMTTGAEDASQQQTRKSMLAKIRSLPSSFANVFPTVTIVLSRLPLPLLPFAFAMFILVQALAHVGFIDIMARGLGRVCAQGGSAGTAFFISFLGIVLCNVGGTNIGATILLTKALQTAQFRSQLPASDAPLLLKTALFSVAFGSNVGALGGTFAASLAGLLWRSGLRQGGVYVSARQFALWCLVTIAPATIAGVAVLLAEVTHFTIANDAFV